MPHIKAKHLAIASIVVAALIAFAVFNNMVLSWM